MSTRVQIPQVPAPRAPHLTPVRFGTLQRKCACGGSGDSGGECQECKQKKRILQRCAAARAEPGTVPPIVNDVLRSPGQPLNAATRAFFEPRFGHDFSRVRVHESRRGMIQAKMMVGPPGDRFEQEADRVAESVMRMPIAPLRDGTGEHPGPGPQSARSWRPQSVETLQRDPLDPYAPEEEVAEEQEGVAQAKPCPGAAAEVPPGLTARIRRVADGGEPLPRSVRTFMEPRFGHDFSRVRIHTDRAAAELARSIHARAFTLGPDLVFGAHQFAPETDAGRRLLAHELTHAIQQGQAPRSSGPDPAIHPPASGGLNRRDPAPPRQVDEASERAPASASIDSTVIRRVIWSPNVDSGKKSRPWGSRGPNGKVLRATTDAGTPIDIWKPDDGQTYWCHGFTFGGTTAPGGPYSLWGQDVPTVLRDDGWQPQVDSCAARPGDILVLEGNQPVTHSGIVGSVTGSGGGVDESASILESKWGSGPQTTTSWEANAVAYGMYRCYSKSPTFGHCRYRGVHEAVEELPLPPGDFPVPSGETRVA